MDKCARKNYGVTLKPSATQLICIFEIYFSQETRIIWRIELNNK